MSTGLALSVGIASARSSIASHRAYATSSGISAWTTIGQPLKSSVGTSWGSPGISAADIVTGRKPIPTSRSRTAPSTGRKRNPCSSASPAQLLIPSSKTALTWPDAMPERRAASLGRDTGWMLPPHARMSASEKPAAESTASTVNIVPSSSNGGSMVVRVERFSAGRRSAISASDVMPVDSCTAKPMTSHDGKTAMGRSAKASAKGPVPATAIVSAADGLIQCSETSPCATASRAARNPPARNETLTASAMRPGMAPSSTATRVPTRESI